MIFKKKLQIKFVADILDKVIGKWFKMDDATGSINSNMDKLGGVVKGIGTALWTSDPQGRSVIMLVWS